MKILLVEDDVNLREVVQRSLEKERYIVEVAPDFRTGIQKIEDYTYDCILLDIMLPDGNGLELLEQLKEMRKRENVIIISAKDSLEDKVLGLELGADDYLPKPFNPNELLARIRAVLRRQVREVPGAPSQQVEVVSFGPWSLDLSTRTLTREGQVVTLTTGEFAVLKALVQHPREPLTRDKLMNLARGREWGAMERSIDVQVSRLRRLIEDNPARARYIQTVWGVGYVFVPDGAE